MKFWDSSAIMPLIVNEPSSMRMSKLLTADPFIAAWWGTTIECRSAIARLRRQGIFSSADETSAINLLKLFSDGWTEILPGDVLRETAYRLLSAHPLRAADAMQLSAAMIWAGDNSGKNDFICLDERLREAAYKEGFKVLP